MEHIRLTDLLLEYRGENFMKPLLAKLEALDADRDKIRKIIIDKKLRSTSTDRHFKYVEEFLDKALRYSKLGVTSLEQIGADK